MPAGTRDPWLDNAKMGLVVLVVVGHLLALLPSDGLGGRLYDFVYLWHMPAFVFLSGYLSRSFAYSSTRMWQLVTTLLVPYVLFEGALGWFRINVGGERLQDMWVDPHFPMWYLLALVAWRLVTPVFRSIALPVLAAVAVCLVGGFVTGDWTRWLDLPRIVGFLPFFVLGLQATPERLERLRGRVPALLGVATFGLLWLMTVDFGQWADRNYLYYKPYEMLDAPLEVAVLTRLVLLAAGVAGALAWLALVPRIGGWFTRMGAATMIVYLCHGFAVKSLEYVGFVEWAHDRPTAGLAVAGVGGVALASPPVRRVLGPAVDPFSPAEQQLREAVRLTEVVQEQEGVHEAELVSAGR